MTDTKNNIGFSLRGWFREAFYESKMNSLPGWIVMALVGIGLSYLGVHFNEKLPLLVPVAAAGILFVLICFQYPEFAYYSYIFSIIVFTLPARLWNVNIPLGFVIEPVGYLAVFVYLARQYRERENSTDFWKTPISLMMVLLFAYFLLQAFNPEIDSRSGWFNYFRKQIIYILFYYISFLHFDSLKKIKQFVKIWIILATFIAIWGCKQQWLGFTENEKAWIYSDPNVTALLFQAGMFRKFSLLPDPATFGVLTASTSLFTLIFAIRIPHKKTRMILFAITGIMVLASTYSGTRTCNVMIIGGLAAYVIFTLNEKKTIMVLLYSLFGILFLLLGPFKNNPIVFRIKTTFEGSKEPSNMVRDFNRHNIQPYIYAHPIGGGLNTCGEEGLHMYPNHPLAGYPPDSGYMKIMLEQGSIGLFINIVFYFIILQTGVSGFYNSRRPEIKNIYMAFTICLFSLIVGQYSQLAISQYPQYLFYLAALVIFYKLKEYDTKLPEDYEPLIA